MRQNTDGKFNDIRPKASTPRVTSRAKDRFLRIEPTKSHTYDIDIGRTFLARDVTFIVHSSDVTLARIVHADREVKYEFEKGVRYKMRIHYFMHDYTAVRYRLFFGFDPEEVQVPRASVASNELEFDGGMFVGRK